MNEARIAQYLDLIQRLLSCSGGEQGAILQGQREFWDEESLGTLQREAGQLRGMGRENEAGLLEILAGQLMEVLGSGGELPANHQNYLEFIKALFQAERENYGLQNSPPVNKILSANQHLLDRNFSQVLENVFNKLIKEQPEVKDDFVARIENITINIYNVLLCNRVNNPEIAIAGYHLILQHRLEGTDKWAQTQNNLGNAYSCLPTGDIGQNIQSAINCYKNALRVWQETTAPQLWAIIKNNLGNAYSDLPTGDIGQNIQSAINCYKNALRVRQADTTPLDWAMTQNNLGNAYQDLPTGDREQNIQSAIACYLAALHAWKEDTTQWAMAQNNLGTAYKNLPTGDIGQNIQSAICCYENALRVWHESTLDWAMTQNNLGNAYQELPTGDVAMQLWSDREQNIERAINCYENALRVRQADTTPLDWAMTQNNLGNAYQELSTGDQRNIQRAIACYEAALRVRTCEAFPQDHIVTLWNLGALYKNNQRWQLAYDTYESAIKTVDSLRSEIQSGDETKQKLAEEWNGLYLGMVEVCIELAATKPTYYTKAIEYAERSKARNLVELLATHDLQPKGVSQTIVDQLSRLRREIDAEQRRLDNQRATRNSDLNTGERSLTLTTSPTGIDRAHLNQLQQQLSDLITNEISPIDPEFALTQKVTPIPYPEIQTLTGTNTAILEWYILNDKFLTFIITPDPPLTPPTLREAKPTKGGEQEQELESPSLSKEPNNSKPPFLRGAGGIQVYQSSSEDFAALTAWSDRYLTDYRQADKTPWRDNLAPRLQELAKILHIEEILKKIPTQCDRLILIPHRFLHLFPLHALSIDSSSQTLLDLFPQGVSYAPSCQLLQQAQNRQRPDFNHLFAIQNPTNDLLFTDLEVAAIKQHFDPQDVLVQSEAKKSRIDDRRLQAAHCAHFSCHGYFNFAQPLFSALLLADSQLTPPLPTEDPDRYLPLRDGNAIDLSKCLTLADIFALDFRSCRLVVLSACETGISDFQSISDEYISLPSGFLVAGSSSVVPTLWAVNDLSTSFLMIKFYQLLKNGFSVAIALNSAQRWLRDVTKEELQAWTSQLSLSSTQRNVMLPKFFNKMEANTKPFQSPFYWAAFCAVGQ